MLDHEEKFLFKEEIVHLANAVAEPGILDNVEDLLTDVITSPRFDSEVFTLERSLQVMLGARAGTTLVGLLTVAPEVFDEGAEVRVPPEAPDRPRGGAAGPAGPADPRSLQQRAPILRGRRGRLPRAHRRHHGSPGTVSRAGRHRRRHGLAAPRRHPARRAPDLRPRLTRRPPRRASQARSE